MPVMAGGDLPWTTLGMALCLAWALDQWLGDPPNAWHPVAWLGHVLGSVGRMLKGRWAPLALGGGAVAWLGLAAVLGTLAAVLQQAVLRLPWPLAAGVLAVVVKPLFAWRLLRDEVSAVEDAMRTGLGAGRERLARLVSRDVRTLDAVEVRESAIETLAENLNDSVVSPLLWFVCLGLPGLVVYRLANTADAMWGYRGAWEWAGKWAAVADDVLSWPGARLSAWLISPTLSWRKWSRLRRESRLTPSPNGGWPMGAMALTLGVRLSKPGVYVLHESGRTCEGIDVRGALFLAAKAAWSAALLSAGTLLSAGWIVQIAEAGPVPGHHGVPWQALGLTLLARWVPAWAGT